MVIHFYIIGETWLKSDKNEITSLVKTYGYTLLHNRRNLVKV